MVSRTRHLLLVALLNTCPMACLAAEAHEAKASELAARIEVPAGASMIVIIEQKGVDLLARVEGPGVVAEPQDGPDSRYGSEILVLRNATDTPASFDVHVVSRYRGPVPQYELISRAAEDADELALALALSRAARTWHAG